MAIGGDGDRSARGGALTVPRSAGWRRLPWPLYEIRQLGDWGHASNHLGRAWELHASQHLLDNRIAWGSVVEAFTPIGFVPLGVDPSIEAALSQARLRAPDGFVAGVAGSTPIILAVDFKFSLDHAEGGQIVTEVAETAGRALEPATTEALRPILGDAAERWPDLLVAGALVSPPSASNLRTKVPHRPRLHWLATEPEPFFGDLPASEAMRFLRTIDELHSVGDDFDLGEAYYRLGAGVAGAITRLDRSVFLTSEPGAMSPAPVDRLHEVAIELGARSAADLVERLRPLVAARRERQAKLGQLLRRPAGREAINRAAGLAAETPSEQWPAEIRSLVGIATLADRNDVLARGLELVASGLSDDGAIAQIGSEHRARAARFLKRLSGDSG